MGKGKATVYSNAEMAWIKAHSREDRRAMHRAFQQRFGRPDVLQANLAALCKRKGWLTGRSGRFEAGMVPYNTGKKMPFNANTARTQFKPGQRPHNTKFAGHERIIPDGYVEISVNEKNPHTGYGRRYVQKHRHLWEKKNGKVPPGHCLKCLDGNRRNTAPDNWIVVPRAVLPRLNGRWTEMPYDSAPAEIKPLLLTVAKLTVAIKGKRKRSAQG